MKSEMKIRIYRMIVFVAFVLGIALLIADSVFSFLRVPGLPLAFYVLPIPLIFTILIMNETFKDLEQEPEEE